MEKRKVLVGLVGFRCCGKSELRKILGNLGYPVFDTNSVRTGHTDASKIPIDEVLQRYGRDKSYLLFLQAELKEFVHRQRGIIFIDSLKVDKDVEVLTEMFPDCAVELWYLHASYQTRMSRYLSRDIKTNMRFEKLKDHDNALERRGIWDLIKRSSEAINMQIELPEVQERVKKSIRRLVREYPWVDVVVK